MEHKLSGVPGNGNVHERNNTRTANPSSTTVEQQVTAKFVEGHQPFDNPSMSATRSPHPTSQSSSSLPLHTSGPEDKRNTRKPTSIILTPFRQSEASFANEHSVSLNVGPPQEFPSIHMDVPAGMTRISTATSSANFLPSLPHNKQLPVAAGSATTFQNLTQGAGTNGRPRSMDVDVSVELSSQN